MTGHPDTERFLARFDATIVTEHDTDLDLRAIDLVASVLNQSRFEALHADTVDRYVAALEDGAVFPPVIVRRVTRPNGTDQLVILGGNHRVRAHIDAGRKTIDAYVVDCDELTALEIAYADNAAHGLPPTEAERYAHVEVLVAHGRSAAEACRLVGVSNGKYGIRQRTLATEARAEQLGVADELARLAPSTKSGLAAVDDDRIFAKLVKVFDEHQVASGPAGAQRFISAVQSQPDRASAMDAIALELRDLAERRTQAPGRGHNPVAKNPYLQLRLALGQIKGLNAADIVDRCPRGDLEQLHQLLLAGGRHLMAIDTLTTAGRSSAAVSNGSR